MMATIAPRIAATTKGSAVTIQWDSAGPRANPSVRPVPRAMRVAALASPARHPTPVVLREAVRVASLLAMERRMGLLVVWPGPVVAGPAAMERLTRVSGAILPALRRVAPPDKFAPRTAANAFQILAEMARLTPVKLATRRGQQ